jgi:hypothetical protein
MKYVKPELVETANAVKTIQLSYKFTCTVTDSPTSHDATPNAYEADE